MVATTFAADTPLAATELVARNGIAGCTTILLNIRKDAKAILPDA
jgi:hypothetical protein